MRVTGTTGNEHVRAPIGRLRSLDGLRGVAALVVLVHHCLLTVPALAEPYYQNSKTTDGGAPAQAVTYSPLHVFWAGTEAVYVFFVLSGLVLALPVLSYERFSWVRYYPQRLARLYLPVIAAVLFGILTVLLVARSDMSGASRWLQLRPADVTAEGWLLDTLLVSGDATRLISPLWSLRWEVLFSLALPLYLLVAVKVRRASWVLLLGALAASFVGDYAGISPLVFMPMFAVGVLLATNLTAVRAACQSIRTWGWWALLVLAVVLLTWRWTLVNFTTSSVLFSASRPLAVVGAGLVVVIAAFWQPAVRVLTTRPIQVAGKLSFSLYLIHEPIVIAVAHLLGTDHMGWVLPVAVPISLLGSWAFYAAVEGPSHEAAKRIGAWVDQRQVSRSGATY